LHFFLGACLEFFDGQHRLLRHPVFKTPSFAIILNNPDPGFKPKGTTPDGLRYDADNSRSLGLSALHYYLCRWKGS